MSIFGRLKTKWKVGWVQFALIFTTFALGGSLCARLSSFILLYIFSESSVWYWIVYVPLVTILWPFCVLVISIPFGQFSFFTNYLKNMGKKMGFYKEKI